MKGFRLVPSALCHCRPLPPAPRRRFSQISLSANLVAQQFPHVDPAIDGETDLGPTLVCEIGSHVFQMAAQVFRGRGNVILGWI
jgi:hypothetical protein